MTWPERYGLDAMRKDHISTWFDRYTDGERDSGGREILTAYEPLTAVRMQVLQTRERRAVRIQETDGTWQWW